MKYLKITISRYRIYVIFLFLFSSISFAADHNGNEEGIEDTQVVNYPRNIFRSLPSQYRVRYGKAVARISVR